MTDQKFPIYPFGQNEPTAPEVADPVRVRRQPPPPVHQAPPPRPQPYAPPRAYAPPPQPQYAPPPVVVYSPPPVYAAPPKSPTTAGVLAFFFGPLGMLYSTTTGALVMFLINLVLIWFTVGLILFVTIPVGVIWAVNAANEHNQKHANPYGRPY